MEFHFPELFTLTVRYTVPHNDAKTQQQNFEIIKYKKLKIPYRMPSCHHHQYYRGINRYDETHLQLACDGLLVRNRISGFPGEKFRLDLTFPKQKKFFYSFKNHSSYIPMLHTHTSIIPRVIIKILSEYSRYMGFSSQTV